MVGLGTLGELTNVNLSGNSLIFVMLLQGSLSTSGAVAPRIDGNVTIDFSGGRHGRYDEL
ncbi:MAG: hypothetical protein JWR21_463 [Herminiimonas sp.]|nr:hypothetical protein [Herminiimonas sp.]MDB5852486.1 hypothetical protein [Herminiimonas sp.]